MITGANGNNFQSRNPPAKRWVKVNFDTSTSTDGFRGMGIVILDEKMKLVVTGTMCVRALWGVQTGKVAATMFGLEVALRLGFWNVHLEGDALGVISKIANGTQGYFPIFPFYE